MQFELFRRHADLGAPRVGNAGRVGALVIQGADLVKADDDLIYIAAVGFFARSEDHRRYLAILRLALHVVACEIGFVENVVVAGRKAHRQQREDKRADKPVIGLEVGHAHVGQIVVGLPALGDLRLDGSVRGGIFHFQSLLAFLLLVRFGL